jgi:hypothetical protein
MTNRAKAAIQSVLDRYPVLRRNRFTYYIQRYRQTRVLKVDYSLAPPGRRDIIEALERDGLFIIENFMPRETCERIIAEYAPHFAQVMDGTFQGRCDKDPRWGPFRIGGAELYSETAGREFFDNTFIRQVAAAFVSEKAESYRREVDYKVNPGVFMQSDLPHVDDWRHRFKAFLYLTDVGPDNGPLVYYVGSHRQDDHWKDRYYRELEVDGMTGRCGQFFPYEWECIRDRYGFREHVCLGSAGTLIFGDFRGVHRGQPIASGTRILLNNTFGITLDGFF